MAISWLSALKVVPWDKVMEHAPGVLDKARGLIDKHRGASTPVSSPVDPDPAQEVPSLGELKNRCLALQMQLEAQATAQQHMAQTLADMAEQQAGMIAMVKRLQSQLKWLIACFALTVLACVVLFFMK
jgi:hypothetical protein